MYNQPVSDALRAGLTISCVVSAHNSDATNYQRRLFVLINIEAQPVASTSFHNSPKKEQQMPKVTDVIQKNVDLSTSAAFLEAGRIANKQLSGVAGKKLPIMVRAYADTSLGRLILANIALLAQEHFRPDDVRLQKLANAMTVSAYQEVLQQFDIESFIDDLLSNATIKKALKTVDSEA